MKSITLRIYGKVQGVYYRASTRTQAQRLGLVGWVQNQPDASVQAFAQGAENDLHTLIEWCQQGPPAAHVTKVEVVWSKELQHFESFEVRR